MDIDYPYRIDRRGRTATTGLEDHVRDLLEQLLFTRLGERVNRPDFGTRLPELVFAPNSAEVADALQAAVEAAIARWLSDLVEVADLQVVAEDSRLEVVLSYVILQTGQPQELRVPLEPAP
jgi:uncharacterized protein